MAKINDDFRHRISSASDTEVIFEATLIQDREVVINSLLGEVRSIHILEGKIV